MMNQLNILAAESCSAIACLMACSGHIPAKCMNCAHCLIVAVVLLLLLLLPPPAVSHALTLTMLFCSGAIPHALTFVNVVQVRAGGQNIEGSAGLPAGSHA